MHAQWHRCEQSSDLFGDLMEIIRCNPCSFGRKQ
jgi:hypothetical protein